MTELKTDRKIPRQYDRRKRERLKLLEFFLLAIVILFLVFRFVIGLSFVNGISMTPTMRNGDLVVISRLARNYEVGDVVSIKMPSGDYYIKRIAAVEGDQVELRDGVLYVNGIPEEADYAYGETNAQEENILYPLTLSEGMFFVLGDNRQDSIDSRTYGPMALSQIQGKVLFHVPFGK